MPSAVVNCALLALLIWSSPAATGAKPVPPQQATLIDDPHYYISAERLGDAGEEEEEELAGSGGALPFGGGVDASRSYAHSVSKTVRSKTSYQTWDMAAPRVTGCEAVCALQRIRDVGGDD